MVPDVFAVVSGSPYGEYQLMQYGVQQNRTAQLRAAIQVSIGAMPLLALSQSGSAQQHCCTGQRSFAGLLSLSFRQVRIGMRG